MQSRRHSLLEAGVNTLSGFIISVLTGEIIFPLMGFPVNHLQNIQIVLIFTVISIIRSYVWRRVFNWWHHRPKPQVLKVCHNCAWAQMEWQEGLGAGFELSTCALSRVKNYNPTSSNVCQDRNFKKLAIRDEDLLCQ